MPTKLDSNNTAVRTARAVPRGRKVADQGASVGQPDISKTVDNALLVLDTIVRLGPIPLGEISAELKLNRTVVFRLLTTLQRWCYIIKFGNAYVAGPALIRLADGVLPAFRKLVTPVLQRLGSQTRETVSCAVRDGNSWVVVEQVLDSYHAVHVREELGTRYPLHMGAHGYALMAALSDEALAAYYARHTVPENIKSDIVATKALGYATSQGALRDGIMGIAAKGMFKDMVFSIAVIIPTLRATDILLHLSPLLDAVNYMTDRAE